MVPQRHRLTQHLGAQRAAGGLVDRRLHHIRAVAERDIVAVRRRPHRRRRLPRRAGASRDSGGQLVDGAVQLLQGPPQLPLLLCEGARGHAEGAAEASGAGANQRGRTEHGVARVAHQRVPLVLHWREPTTGTRGGTAEAFGLVTSRTTTWCALRALGSAPG